MNYFTLLIKPVSAVCNLDCKYCFYKRAINVFEKKDNYLMSDEVLRNMISKYLGLGFRENAFGWQGGEPTVAGLDFFEKIVKYQMEYGTTGQIVSNSLQTNGVLIDDNWGDFLNEYKFLVGLSLDGPQEIHDFYRVDYSNKGSFKAVMNAADKLIKHNVEFNILTVLTEYNYDKAEIMYDFFIKNGFRFLQFIPTLEVDETTNKIRDFTIKPAHYLKFLKDLFDIWYERGFPEVSIRTFDSILSYYVDGIQLICPFMKECNSYLVIEHNGDVFPCDFFVYKEWTIGNIVSDDYEDIRKSEKYLKFVKMKTEVNDKCRNCKWFNMCYGDCTKFRIFQNRSPKSISYFCPAWKEFFQYSHSRFKKLADQVIEYRKNNGFV